MESGEEEEEENVPRKDEDRDWNEEGELSNWREGGAEVSISRGDPINDGALSDAFATRFNTSMSPIRKSLSELFPSSSSFYFINF